MVTPANGQSATALARAAASSQGRRFKETLPVGVVPLSTIGGEEKLSSGAFFNFTLESERSGVQYVLVTNDDRAVDVVVTTAPAGSSQFRMKDVEDMIRSIVVSL